MLSYFLHQNWVANLPLAKLVMVGARLISNSLNGNTPVDIQLATFLLLYNTNKLSIGAKPKKFW